MAKQGSVNINKEVLVNALSLLNLGLSNKDIIESGQCFSFHPDQIVTYNDDISICVPMKTGITGAVRAVELYQLVNKIDSDELNLQVSGNELKIKGGRTKAGLRLEGKVLPSIDIKNEFRQLPEGFFKALHFCQFSASRNRNKPHLTCVHIQGQFFTSSDGHRITEMWLEQPSPYDFLLPAERIKSLPKQGLTHMSLDRTWAHFINEQTGAVFSCRLRAGKELNVAKHFEIEGQSLVLPEELVQVTERAKIMTQGDTDLELMITLRLENNKLTCRAEKTGGWIEETLDIDYQGSPRELPLNPIFLAEILTHTREIMISERMCMFWGDNFRHVMMMMVAT